MSLLNLFKKQNKDVIASYTLASHFKGYKALPMVVFGDELAMKNNKTLNSSDLMGKTIEFKKADKAVKVYIDKLLVGTIYDSGNIKELENHLITSVYAQNTIESVVDKKKITKRAKIRLFAKYGG